MKKINLTLFPVPKRFWMMESPQIDIAQLYWDLNGCFWDKISMHDYRFLFFKENKINYIEMFSNINFILNWIYNNDLKLTWYIKDFYDYFEKYLIDDDYFIFPISVLEQFRIEYILPALLFSYFFKKKYPNKKIILFWNYPWKHARLIMEKFVFIDIIVLNWDNLWLLNYIKWKSNENIIYRDLSVNKLVEWLNNYKIFINDFNIPNFDKFDLDFYTKKWKLVLPYELSRWCKNSCFYCYYIHKWWNVYEKNTDQVIDELSKLKLKYKTNLFHFHDAEINFDNKYLEKLCDKIITKNINIFWTALAIPRNLDYNLLKKLYDSWCRQLRFWIESWSQRLLNLIWKWTNLYEIIEILRNCKELWISTYATFIVDLKQETNLDIKETLKFMKYNKNYLDDIQMCSYWELWNFKINYLEELNFPNFSKKKSKKKMLFEQFQYNLWIGKKDIIDFIRKF